MQVDFFKKYVPEGSRVHLIGHSIGSYVILELLKVPEISSKITDCYLLFPTIERMAESPNGKFLVNFMSYLYMVPVLLSYIFLYLPSFLQYILIYFYCLITRMETKFIPITCHLIRPTILSKIFFMAFDEMDIVKNLDVDILRANKHRVKLYYSVNDGWAPLRYARELMEEHPDVNAEICSRNFDHAYILRHSKESAEMVAEWIRPKL